ncbi:MAG: hypothetical protein ACLVBW_15645, partial [Lachnospiraceae bacterium]
AQGWVEEDGTWYFYDKDGSRVEDTWKKSGDNWFWLDSEEGGAMATDKLVEDDDNTYYVDGNGVMVTNTWVKVVNEEQDEDDDPAEYRYYYMQSNGKAYKGNGNNLSKKTIDGKQYAFDEDGKMLYGWVKTDGTMANGEDEWQDAYYYFGGWEDGSLKTGWQKITVHDPSSDKDDDYDYWFNFKANGKKRTHAEDNDTWKSNGKYYHFNQYGVMVYEWFNIATSGTTNPQSASNWAYFSSPEDGARYTKGWFKVAPPTEDNSFAEVDDTFANNDSKDESDRWYYSNGHDEGLAVGEIKKIKGKYYGFWPDDGEKAGRMLTGLCALKMSGSKIVDVIDDDMDADGLDDFMDKYGTESQANSDVYLYYFGNDADTDGAMKTGNVTINLDGDSYQFQFKKNGDASSRGRGVNGIDDGKYIYQYGQKVKADSDEKYILVKAVGNINSDTATVDVYESKDIRTEFAKTAFQVTGTDATVNGFYGFGSAYYLVNTSGRIQTGTKTGVKDGDDMYWYMNNNKIVMYTDSKELKGTKLNSNGWKTVDFSKLSK